MLDMAYDDIDFIIQHLPKNAKTYCFLATMPPKIRTLAKRFFK
jgi:superfamily II DNA/RNA helicase